MAAVLRGGGGFRLFLGLVRISGLLSGKNAINVGHDQIHADAIKKVITFFADFFPLPSVFDFKLLFALKLIEEHLRHIAGDAPI